MMRNCPQRPSYPFSQFKTTAFPIGNPRLGDRWRRLLGARIWQGMGQGMQGMCRARGQTEFQVNLKLGLTLRQEARERRIISKCETFHRNPAGNQPRPAEPGQQPEASLARWVGDRLVVLHISQGRSRAESIPGPGEIMHTLQT